MNSYNLLPFYFETIGGKEFLVNEIGDFLILPLGSVKNIVTRKIERKSELFKTLHSKFFISDQIMHPLFDIYASRLAAKKSHIETKASLHIFVLTLRCNQNCSYCQASSSQSLSKNLSIKKRDLIKAIELMFQSNSANITMEFQGGEPTLEFDLIKFAVEYASKLNDEYKKNLSFVVCTNCINISDEFISLCKKYEILISSSFDGPKWIHEKNRGCKGCYNSVIAGFDKVRSALGNDSLSVLMTCSEISLHHPKEIIDEYIKTGFTNIFLRALNPYGRALETKDWEKYTLKYIEFYKGALSYIIDLNLKGIFFREDYATVILRKILTSFGGNFVDLQSPAGCIQSVIVYNYDGNVYCSDESRMLAEDGDYRFILGKVSDNYSDLIFGKTAKEISMVSSNECLAGCSDCAFKIFCGADPVRNYASQNDIYGNRPHSLFCMKNRAIISYLIELIITKGETVMPIFTKWLL